MSSINSSSSRKQQTFNIHECQKDPPLTGEDEVDPGSHGNSPHSSENQRSNSYVGRASFQEKIINNMLCQLSQEIIPEKTKIKSINRNVNFFKAFVKYVQNHLKSDEKNQLYFQKSKKSIMLKLKKLIQRRSFTPQCVRNYLTYPQKQKYQLQLSNFLLQIYNEFIQEYPQMISDKIDRKKMKQDTKSDNKQAIDETYDIIRNIRYRNLFYNQDTNLFEKEMKMKMKEDVEMLENNENEDNQDNQYQQEQKKGTTMMMRMD